MVRSPLDDIPFAIKALKHITITVHDLSITVKHYPTAFGTQVNDPMVCKCHFLYHLLTHAYLRTMCVKKHGLFCNFIGFFLFSIVQPKCEWTCFYALVVFFFVVVSSSSPCLVVMLKCYKENTYD